MSHPDSARMLFTLLDIVNDPLANPEMRSNAIRHAYELGKIEGHYAGVMHAVSNIGKPKVPA